jgi:hypothetical protein
MSQLPDGSVWQEDGEWVVDPEVIAPKLGLSTAEFRQAMRDGHVRGTVERGEGDDAGRTRLTFRYANNAYAIQIEADGTAHETTPPPNPRAAARGPQSSLH